MVGERREADSRIEIRIFDEFVDKRSRADVAVFVIDVHGVIAGERGIASYAVLDVFLHGVDDANAAAYACKREEERHSDDRHADERGIDARCELTKEEHVQPAQVERLCHLRRFEQEARKREEEQHRPRAHENRFHEQVRHVVGKEPCAQQHGVRITNDAQRDDEQGKRKRQVAQAGFVVLARACEQVDELRFCEVCRIPKHRYSEDDREGRCGHRERFRRKRQGHAFYGLRHHRKA